MSKFKIKSNKWYGRIWPPERRKVKILQVIFDHKAPEIEKQIREAQRLGLIYGLTEQEAIKWIKEQDQNNANNQR